MHVSQRLSWGRESLWTLILLATKKSWSFEYCIYVRIRLPPLPVTFHTHWCSPQTSELPYPPFLLHHTISWVTGLHDLPSPTQLRYNNNKASISMFFTYSLLHTWHDANPNNHNIPHADMNAALYLYLYMWPMLVHSRYYSQNPLIFTANLLQSEDKLIATLHVPKFFCHVRLFSEKKISI